MADDTKAATGAGSNQSDVRVGSTPTPATNIAPIATDAAQSAASVVPVSPKVPIAPVPPSIPLMPHDDMGERKTKEEIYDVGLAEPAIPHAPITASMPHTPEVIAPPIASKLSGDTLPPVMKMSDAVEKKGALSLSPHEASMRLAVDAPPPLKSEIVPAPPSPTTTIPTSETRDALRVSAQSNAIPPIAVKPPISIGTLPATDTMSSPAEIKPPVPTVAPLAAAPLVPNTPEANEPHIISETIIPPRPLSSAPYRPPTPPTTDAPPGEHAQFAPPKLEPRHLGNDIGAPSEKQGNVSNTGSEMGAENKSVTNFSKLLKDIKLPERFSISFSGEKKPPVKAPTSEPVILSETVRPANPQGMPVAQSPLLKTPAPSQAPKTLVPPTALGGQSLQTPVTPPLTAQSSTPATIVPPIQPGTSAATGGDTDAHAAMQMDPSKVTSMRTLKEDLMHVVRDRKISLVRAAALEEDKKRNVHQPSPSEIAMSRQRSRRVFGIVFTVMMLFLLGSAALFGVFTIQNQQAPVQVSGNESSMIFTEQQVAFPLEDLSGNEIKRLLAQARGSSKARLGSITRVVPTITAADATGQAIARPATTAEFFTAIQANAPEELIRALKDDFFFGIHTIDKNAPLMIFPVDSYEHAFSGMLAWEAEMNTDLQPAFTAVPAFSTDANGLPALRIFKDIIIRNYDARAIKDDSGNIVLYYSFPNPSVLVIAEDQYSFAEILSRLQVARRL